MELNIYLKRVMEDLREKKGAEDKEDSEPCKEHIDKKGAKKGRAEGS